MQILGFACRLESLVRCKLHHSGKSVAFLAALYLGRSSLALAYLPSPNHFCLSFKSLFACHDDAKMLPHLLSLKMGNKQAHEIFLQGTLSGESFRMRGVH